MLRILSKKEEIDTSNRNKKDLEYVEIDGIKINPHKLLLSQTQLFDKKVKNQVDYLKLLEYYSPKTKIVDGKHIKDLLQIDLPPSNDYFQNENKHSTVYVYAGYVRPGKHTVILYDKYSDSFYQKNILIQQGSSEEFTNNTEGTEIFDQKCYRVNRLEMYNGGQYSILKHQSRLIEQLHVQKIPQLMYLAEMNAQRVLQNKLLIRMVLDGMFPENLINQA